MYDIDITTPAQDYLGELLQKKDDATNVRLFVLDGGTPKAETCLSYCILGEEKATDVIVDLGKIKVFLDQESIPYLKGAKVDYKTDEMGGQLTIRAPNARTMQIDKNSSLQDKVNYVIWNQINPELSLHNGEVSLVKIKDKTIAVLKFGGGCQGCAQLDITLKEGVEKTLKEQCPDLTSVQDITDHSDTSNAYF